jgi:hypothetical protein
MTQWKAFARKGKLSAEPAKLEVVISVEHFPDASLRAAAAGRSIFRHMGARRTVERRGK